MVAVEVMTVEHRRLELQGLGGRLVECAVTQLPRAREHGRELLFLVVGIVHEAIEIRRARGLQEMAIWLMEKAIWLMEMPILLVLEMAIWQMVRRRLWLASRKR
jgi:hypothetical protein